MTLFKWLNLQLFAGEGAGDSGGEGAATGESAVDPGQQRLRELGVPEDKIQRRAKRSQGKATAPAAIKAAHPQQTQPQTEPQAAAANNPTEEPKADPPAGMTWDEVINNPEFNGKIQSIVQSRLRSAKGAEETLGKLAPALELLARKHGLDPENPDYEALAKAISDDNAYYEDKAMEMGVDIDTAKRIDQEERNTARQQRQQAQTLEEQKYQNHILDMEQQGEEMKKTFPDFDLRKELKNPVFARITAPGIGLSVEDAYYAVHRREIQAKSMQVAAQKTAEKISNAIQSGSMRPVENGTSGQAPSVTTFDYRNATPEQRNAFKAHIRSEAAQGRKVYPGSYHG